MRDELAKRDGCRGTFSATFKEHGQRTSGGHFVPTLLFVNVCDANGHEVTDHLWFTQAKCWAFLREGDRVQFCARVRHYWKGYHDCRTRDFKLSHPTDVKVLTAPTQAVAEASGQLALF